MASSKTTMSPLLTLASCAVHVTRLLAPSLVRGLAQASVCTLHPLQLTNRIRQRHFETPSPSHCFRYIHPLWGRAAEARNPCFMPGLQSCIASRGLPAGAVTLPPLPEAAGSAPAGEQELLPLLLDNSTCWLPIYTALCLKDGTVVLFNSKKWLHGLLQCGTLL